MVLPVVISITEKRNVNLFRTAMAVTPPPTPRSHIHSSESLHSLGDHLLTVNSDPKPFKVFCGTQDEVKISVYYSKSD